MLLVELPLYFKGSREYVHGTSMLDAAMMAISSWASGAEIEDLNFSINRMTARKLLCGWWQHGDSLSLQSNPIATFFFKVDGISYEGGLVEIENNVQGRAPFDESVISERCVISLVEKNITLDETPIGISPIEIFVSMNKFLHQKAYEIANDSQWVFCRWESSVWPIPGDTNGVSLTIEQSLGTRLTRSRVELNGKMVGKIYFSARNSEAKNIKT
ncbi:hypothetical protein K9857_23285 [Pseudomonas sp. REP124]|uniref:hypothetical protein n=1 Tax=Pseudomonas sp. REP124 TaxID=2875731 RepID=UPI001CC92609|nr:hypothetical protein [Pseudomonas sp. REP124]MBZ9784466.1 hypothetical protein [Pseudomonas sp. REP124]